LIDLLDFFLTVSYIFEQSECPCRFILAYQERLASVNIERLIENFNLQILNQFHSTQILEELAAFEDEDDLYKNHEELNPNSKATTPFPPELLQNVFVMVLGRKR